MGDMADLITSIENVNVLGVKNLASKGIEIPQPTTKAIMEAISSIPTVDHTVKFTVDGELYEVVSVKDGNEVNIPATEPVKDGFNFGGWGDINGNPLIRPFIPTENTEVIAINWSLSDVLRNAYNIDKEQYPYIYIGLGQTIQLNFYDLTFCFLPSYVLLDTNFSTSGGVRYSGRLYHSQITTDELSNPENIIKYLANNLYTTPNEISSGATFGGQVYTYTNFNCKFGDMVGIGGGHTMPVAHYVFD